MFTGPSSVGAAVVSVRPVRSHRQHLFRCWDPKPPGDSRQEPSRQTVQKRHSKCSQTLPVHSGPGQSLRERQAALRPEFQRPPELFSFLGFRLPLTNPGKLGLMFQ